MMLLAAWLVVAAFPAIPSQQADKVGQRGLSPAEQVLPDCWNGGVKLRLNRQARDFL